MADASSPFVLARAQLDSKIEQGLDLEAIEHWIDTRLLPEESKAALWLWAWAHLPERRKAGAHLRTALPVA